MSICAIVCSENEASVSTEADLIICEMLSLKPFAGKVTGNKVRLRLQSNLESFIVKELDKGDIFAVYGEKDGYYAVRPPKDMKAYVFRTFVLHDTVEGERVNIRLSSNLDAPVIAQLNTGDVVNGTIAEASGKWLEISIPKDTYFWVAKEYVEEIGDLDYAKKYLNRRYELQQLIDKTNLLTQAEFRKPFQEIDIERPIYSLEKMIKDFKEFEEDVFTIRQLITSIQQEYSEKKITFLETKAGIASKEVAALRALIPSNFGKDTNIKNDSHHTDLALKDGKQLQNDLLPNQHMYSSLSKYMTDKMRVWEPVEESLFQYWLRTHPNATVDEYYQDEMLNSVIISGIVEPFHYSMKNKPGDFILRQNNTPIAYIYSTQINLQDKIGEYVTLKGCPRPNNRFAYPAFHIINDN